jgi:hypothetical protein
VRLGATLWIVVPGQLTNLKEPVPTA